MLAAALADPVGQRQASFEVFARKLPTGRQYGVFAGLGRVLDAVEAFRFTDAERGGPVVIYDTEAFATGIWAGRYLGRCEAAVESLARHHPLYLLTDHEGAPFHQDGIRGGEGLRAWMTGRFATELDASGRHWQLLSGNLDERVHAALVAVDTLVAGAWDFADPLG